jgi:hypothetical protein
MCLEYGVTYLSGRTKDFASSDREEITRRTHIDKVISFARLRPTSRDLLNADFPQQITSSRFSELANCSESGREFRPGILEVAL